MYNYGSILKFAKINEAFSISLIFVILPLAIVIIVFYGNCGSFKINIGTRIDFIFINH